MNAILDKLTSESQVVLPQRETPYVLQDVYELVSDDCRVELILQWTEGCLLLRADGDTDSIVFEFQPHHFEPTPNHHCFVEELTDQEQDILEKLNTGAKTKSELDARARILGAVRRPALGSQGGGLQKRGLITGNAQGRNNRYEITAVGRRALTWNKLFGKECSWCWTATNQQGYCDTVILSFEGIVPTVLFHVIGSSIESFAVARN